jgi:hypothetical protein
VFEGIVVLAFLLAIVGFMVKDVFAFRATGSFGKPGGDAKWWTSILLGLVTVAALAGLAERGSLGLESLTVVAMGIGVLSALMARFPALGGMGAWGMSIIGLIAAVPSIASLATGQTACGTTTPALGVFASGALLVIVYVLAAVAAAFAGRGIAPGFGVALFGGVEVIAYLNSPLGIDLIGTVPLAYIASIVGAILLGYAVVKVADLVLGLSAAVILLASLAGGHYCGPGIDYMAGFGTLVGFVVAFAVMSMVLRFVTRKS